MDDTDYNTLLAPVRQIHTGPIFDQSPEACRAFMGQVNPEVQHDLAMQHGRYLSGLGDTGQSKEGGSMSMNEQVDITSELYALEEQDDVYGSGIFDDPRRDGTANSDTGVFASHYNLPGYLARQQPFTYSDEVASLPNGAAYAEVPAGGMHYVEAHGKPVNFPQTGPIPSPPQLRPAAPTGRQHPYAYLQDEEDQEWMTPLNYPQPDTGSTQPPLGQYTHSPYYRVVDGHAQRKPAYMTSQLPTRPAARALKQYPRYGVVPRRAYDGDAPLSEEDSKGANWIVYGVVGLGLGVVSAMVFETVRKKR